jgi:hypothetical protein
LSRTLRSFRCGRPSTGRCTGARMRARSIALLSRRVGESWENLRWEIEELREGDDGLLCEELIEAAPGLVTIVSQRVCGRRDGVDGVELAR